MVCGMDVVVLTAVAMVVCGMDVVVHDSGGDGGVWDGRGGA